MNKIHIDLKNDIDSHTVETEYNRVDEYLRKEIVSIHDPDTEDDEEGAYTVVYGYVVEDKDEQKEIFIPVDSISQVVLEFPDESEQRPSKGRRRRNNRR